MEFTAMQISTLINGEIEGDPVVTVSSFGKLEGAEPGQLAFLANPKYEEFLYSTKASVIIINNTQLVEKKVNATLIRVPDAYSAFAVILSTYEKMAKANLAGVQQPAYISDTAILGENIFIGAFTYIGNKNSPKETHLYSNYLDFCYKHNYKPLSFNKFSYSLVDQCINSLKFLGTNRKVTMAGVVITNIIFLPIRPRRDAFLHLLFKVLLNKDKIVKISTD